MESVSALQIVTYILIIAVIIAFASRLYRYYKMPIHLRWELYPLASEKNRTWGGSYLEEPEWWTKPPEEKSMFGEVRYIGEEIMLFKEYFHKKRDYWYLVYPFHMGVYLMVGFLALLLVGAVTVLAGAVVSAESANVWGRIVYYLTLIAGGASLILGIIGTVGLLIRRMVDNDLKIYTKRIDYFNLIIILAVFLTGFFSWILTDTTFAVAREYTKGLISFGPVGTISAITTVHIVLLFLVAAYIPFTGMMHFFAKTFTYHFVRWDDAANIRGGKLEKGIVQLLNQPISWSAPHLEAVKCWSDAAKDTLANEESKPQVQKGVGS